MTVASMCAGGALVRSAALPPPARCTALHPRCLRCAATRPTRLQEAKQLKALMYALVSHTDSDTRVPVRVGDSSTVAAGGRRVDTSDREVAFVFTDIESSTELSNQDADAFKQVRTFGCLFARIAA